MKVNLTYFKTGGKYYSEGSYETSYNSLFDVWDEVRDLLKVGMLPGLSEGSKEFIVLVDAPEHEHNHPRLIIPDLD